MRQHTRLKTSHPDCVLFFRMGDFYELFDDDAVLASRVLGITLTQRTAGVPMAGVPYHALDGYVRRMIEQGHRVAVCDQIQDPKEAKGVVDRAVTRVLTPGTLVDESLLEESVPNLVGAIALDDGSGAGLLALAEISTGRFELIELPAGAAHDELVRLRPSELLFAEAEDGAVPPAVARLRDAIGCALTPRPGWTFRVADARDDLRVQYGVRTLAGFGLDDDDPALGPAGALLRYLKETQAPDAAPGARTLGHLRPPVRRAAGGHLVIDATSLASLEIERTMRSGRTEGSLLSVLQRCTTPMGKRLLRHWLCFPLTDRAAIAERQDAVAALVADRTFARDVAGPVGSVQDVARITGRLAMGRATPRDLVALGRSLTVLDDVLGELDGRPAFAGRRARLERLADVLRPLAETIARECVEAPPAHLRDGGLFADGVDAALDEARGLQRDATTWLAAYQQRLIAETAIPSLKVGFNKVFGYYIEITHAHTAKVPDAFSRKQTLKNAERYITPELKTFEEKVTTAEARAIEREQALFADRCAEAAGHAAPLAAFADVIAELDVLARFAEIAVRFRYVRPTITDDPVLDIRQGRHPVLDRTLGDRFVPNDCVLGGRHEGTEDRSDGDPGSDEEAAGATLALITGPNMAGKSTAIRQAAIITLLAHTGSFVPAERATIGLTDRIFTRIGASDELHAGQSTFMVEMTETANILHHATAHSLVILDEIGRGTSTLDGLALAWAIAETIAERRCRTLFATHYHELTDLADRIDNVANLHVAVREWGEEIVFLHRIQPGRTNRSYGIHVAKIAGVPRAMIDRAQAVLESLAVHTHAAEVAAGPPPDAAARRSAQLDLFTEYVEHPAVQALRELDLERLTPLEAFDRLRALARQARGED